MTASAKGDPAVTLAPADRPVKALEGAEKAPEVAATVRLSGEAAPEPARAAAVPTSAPERVTRRPNAPIEGKV